MKIGKQTAFILVAGKCVALAQINQPANDWTLATSNKPGQPHPLANLESEGRPRFCPLKNVPDDQVREIRGFGKTSNVPRRSFISTPSGFIPTAPENSRGGLDLSDLKRALI